jgi:hypothetical protein
VRSFTESQKRQQKIGERPVLFLSTFGGLNAQCGRSRRRKNAKQKIGKRPVLFLSAVGGLNAQCGRSRNRKRQQKNWRASCAVLALFS